MGQQEELVSFLQHAGHEVHAVENSIMLERCLLQFSPAIVVLDYNLPGESGLTIAARLHERFGSEIGLVMVTARSLAVDRVECRRAGVDDYLVKPIDFDELLLLIDNLQQRLTAPGTIESVWQVNLLRSEIIPPGALPISLTGWEALLLQALAIAPRLQADRDTLMRALGKNPLAYDPRALETNISRLRQKLPLLEDGRNPIQAVRGMGYQFIRALKIVN